MSDVYRSIASSPAGRAILTRLGRPAADGRPRYSPGEPVAAGPVLVGGGDRLREPVTEVLGKAGVAVVEDGPGGADVVYDATALRDPGALGRLAVGGIGSPAATRIVVFGTPPRECRIPAEAATQQALAGFVGSLDPPAPLRRRLAGHLVYVSAGAEDLASSTLRFLLSSRSSCLAGQSVHIAHGLPPGRIDWLRPLDGSAAVVTGAAGPLGAAIAAVLARDGASVICVDHPDTGESLSTLAAEIGGTPVWADLARPEATRAVAEAVAGDGAGGVDVIVHNAGTATQWPAVLDLRLGVPERLNAALLADRLLRPGGRIVLVSALNGGAARRNPGLYATTEAGVHGLVEAQARTLTKHSMTVNAIVPAIGRGVWSAPGPALDVAETIGWLASPASGGVTGNVLRVA